MSAPSEQEWVDAIRPWTLCDGESRFDHGSARAAAALAPLIEQVREAARAEAVAAERERIAQLIEDAALHVMTEADSHEGATLTAAILDRAARIARAGTEEP